MVRWHDAGVLTEGAPAALECDVSIAVAASFTVEARFRLTAGAMVLFGPTGAGKTVTLRALAGLLRPVRGTIRLGGEPLVDVAAGRFVTAQARGVGYSPQHAALFPHLSVADNVLAGAPPGAILDDELVRGLDLGTLLGRAPASLSGGERQRVSLGRALARRPRLLLLDEPLSALHLAERRRVAAWLKAWIVAHAVPTVLVTHDLTEALALADHCAVLEAGRTVAEGETSVLLAG